MVTNTKSYLHSMGRNNSGISNESKQCLTRQAAVLVTWAVTRDLAAHISVHSNTTSEATVRETWAILSSPHGDVINSIKHSRKINLRL